jgi:hypothetical protein
MSQLPGEQQNNIIQQGRNQLQQLHFTVVWVSGQDPDHTKDELHRGSKESRGWQSPRNCSYPQQLILKVSAGNEPIELSKIQFLSHQSKIASKVEIVVADDFDGSNMEYSSTNTERQRSITFEDCRNIRRLGYVSLNSNEQSQYQARELKSINITPQRAMFVKLILHDCWKNDLNPYNQVGIISIQLLGTTQAIKPQSAVENPINAVTAAVSLRSLNHNNHENTPIRIRDRANQLLTLKLHPDIQARIDALEVKKKDRAKMEDFEMASILKDLLKDVRSNFATALQLETKMRKAAEEEEYAEASEYKSQRDSARKSAMDILEKAESSLQNSATITQETLSQLFVVPCQTEHQSVDSINSAIQIRPPSISSAVQRKLGSLSPKARGAQLSNKPSTPDPSDDREKYQENFMGSTYNGSKDLPNCREESPMSTRSGGEAPELVELLESGEHPLEGVPGFQDLPIPEEIIDTRISSEVLMRIEAVLGLYRTKCFFSRNWSLRDAALTKLSLILYSIDIEGSASALCLILERAINDCVVQVFLTGLLLLDECLSEFEKLKMPQKSVVSMVEKVTIALVGKLSDNKPKVSDGAASALLSFASSQCIGPTYIGNHALKAMRPQDSKAGRAVCARLKFLEKLIEEYGDEAVRTEKVIHFIKSSANGFSHKDSDVRTATKDLITAMYKLIGEDVLFMLDGLSAKQLQEYKASFVATRQSSPFKVSIENSSYPLSSAPSPLVTVDSNAGVTPGKLQGRGRGRRRNVIAASASVDHQVQENKHTNSFAKNTHNRSLQHNGQFDDVNQSAHDDGESLKEGKDDSYDST